MTRVVCCLFSCCFGLRFLAVLSVSSALLFLGGGGLVTPSLSWLAFAQFHFNEHIFKLEQDEYASEGITVEHITFTDNQACLDLLELKSTGIFAMIDEEINVPKGSDEGFKSKLLVKHAKARGKHST